MRTDRRKGAVVRVMRTTGDDRGTGVTYPRRLTTTARYAAADCRTFSRLARGFRRVPILP